MSHPKDQYPGKKTVSLSTPSKPKISGPSFLSFDAKFWVSSPCVSHLPTLEYCQREQFSISVRNRVTPGHVTLTVKINV